MELVLIPILLIGGAVLVYLGVHGTQQTAWAMYGPHISTRSGKRLPVPVTPQAAPPVESQPYEEPELVPYSEPSMFVMTERAATIERPREKTAAPVATYASAAFTQSDALIGELITELAMVRDELNALRDRMESLTRPMQSV